MGSLAMSLEADITMGTLARVVGDGSPQALVLLPAAGQWPMHMLPPFDDYQRSVGSRRPCSNSRAPDGKRGCRVVLASERGSLQQQGRCRLSEAGLIRPSRRTVSQGRRGEFVPRLVEPVIRCADPASCRSLFGYGEGLQKRCFGRHRANIRRVKAVFGTGNEMRDWRLHVDDAAGPGLSGRAVAPQASIEDLQQEGVDQATDHGPFFLPSQEALRPRIAPTFSGETHAPAIHRRLTANWVHTERQLGWTPRVALPRRASPDIRMVPGKGAPMTLRVAIAYSFNDRDWFGGRNYFASLLRAALACAGACRVLFRSGHRREYSDNTASGLPGAGSRTRRPIMDRMRVPWLLRQFDLRFFDSDRLLARIPATASRQTCCGALHALGPSTRIFRSDFLALRLPVSALAAVLGTRSADPLGPVSGIRRHVAIVMLSSSAAEARLSRNFASVTSRTRHSPRPALRSNPVGFGAVTVARIAAASATRYPRRILSEQNRSRRQEPARSAIDALEMLRASGHRRDDRMHRKARRRPATRVLGN